MKSIQLSGRVSWPVLALAVVGAPVVAVIGMRVLAPVRGPSQALANDNIAKPPPFVYSPPKTPAEAFALVRTYEGVMLEEFGPSPMLSRAPAVPIKPVVETRPTPKEEPVHVEDPVSFTVTSIMARSGNPLAVINGKLRRIGDSLGGGWSVAAINGESGEVTVQDQRGTQATLKLKSSRDQ